MSSSIGFWWATTAVILFIAYYILFLVKLESANEFSGFSDFSKLLLETGNSDISDLLQEPSENLHTRRRTELLEKIKEERIKEYLDKKNKDNFPACMQFGSMRRRKVVHQA